ncbi:blue light receptor [Phlyctochytrium bullatum]|nr:blue light receptor [Phlyctochytrium bullatum]
MEETMPAPHGGGRRGSSPGSSATPSLASSSLSSPSVVLPPSGTQEPSSLACLADAAAAAAGAGGVDIGADPRATADDEAEMWRKHHPTQYNGRACRDDASGMAPPPWMRDSGAAMPIVVGDRSSAAAGAWEPEPWAPCDNRFETRRKRGLEEIEAAEDTIAMRRDNAEPWPTRNPWPASMWFALSPWGERWMRGSAAGWPHGMPHRPSIAPVAPRPTHWVVGENDTPTAKTVPPETITPHTERFPPPTLSPVEAIAASPPARPSLAPQPGPPAADHERRPSGPVSSPSPTKRARHHAALAVKTVGAVPASAAGAAEALAGLASREGGPWTNATGTSPNGGVAVAAWTLPTPPPTSDVAGFGGRGGGGGGGGGGGWGGMDAGTGFPGEGRYHIPLPPPPRYGPLHPEAREPLQRPDTHRGHGRHTNDDAANVDPELARYPGGGPPRPGVPTPAHTSSSSSGSLLGEAPAATTAAPDRWGGGGFGGVPPDNGTRGDRNETQRGGGEAAPRGGHPGNNVPTPPAQQWGQWGGQDEWGGYAAGHRGYGGPADMRYGHPAAGVPEGAGGAPTPPVPPQVVGKPSSPSRPRAGVWRNGAPVEGFAPSPAPSGGVGDVAGGGGPAGDAGEGVGPRFVQAGNDAGRGGARGYERWGDGGDAYRGGEPGRRYGGGPPPAADGYVGGPNGGFGDRGAGWGERRSGGPPPQWPMYPAGGYPPYYPMRPPAWMGPGGGWDAEKPPVGERDAAPPKLDGGPPAPMQRPWGPAPPGWGAPYGRGRGGPEDGMESAGERWYPPSGRVKEDGRVSPTAAAAGGSDAPPREDGKAFAGKMHPYWDGASGFDRRAAGAFPGRGDVPPAPSQPQPSHRASPMPVPPAGWMGGGGGGYDRMGGGFYPPPPAPPSSAMHQGDQYDRRMQHPAARYGEMAGGGPPPPPPQQQRPSSPPPPAPAQHRRAGVADGEFGEERGGGAYPPKMGPRGGEWGPPAAARERPEEGPGGYDRAGPRGAEEPGRGMPPGADPAAAQAGYYRGPPGYGGPPPGDYGEGFYVPKGYGAALARPDDKMAPVGGDGAGAGGRHPADDYFGRYPRHYPPYGPAAYPPYYGYGGYMQRGYPPYGGYPGYFDGGYPPPPPAASQGVEAGYRGEEGAEVRSASPQARGAAGRKRGGAEEERGVPAKQARHEAGASPTGTGTGTGPGDASTASGTTGKQGGTVRAATKMGTAAAAAASGPSTTSGSNGGSGSGSMFRPITIAKMSAVDDGSGAALVKASSSSAVTPGTSRRTGKASSSSSSSSASVLPATKKGSTSSKRGTGSAEPPDNTAGGGGGGAAPSGGREVKRCEHCHTSESPEWRRGPTGPKTLCNACGLRYARNIAKLDSVAHGILAASLAGSSSSVLPGGDGGRGGSKK